nr:MAG TPA: hypothetical protein [Caudoviricetes sp.]
MFYDRISGFVTVSAERYKESSSISVAGTNSHYRVSVNE